jgi:hypothetical protein
MPAALRIGISIISGQGFDRMSMNRMTRRQACGATLLGLSSIPVLVESARAQAKPLPLLSVTDPVGKALGYIEDATKVDKKTNPTYKPGQICSNCLQWDEKTAVPQGKCKLFPGKAVKAAGWCKSYLKMPG